MAALQRFVDSAGMHVPVHQACLVDFNTKLIMLYLCCRFIVGEAGRHGMEPGAASRGPTSLQNFYTGTAVIYNALGGHVIALCVPASVCV